MSSWCVFRGKFSSVASHFEADESVQCGPAGHASWSWAQSQGLLLAAIALVKGKGEPRDLLSKHQPSSCRWSCSRLHLRTHTIPKFSRTGVLRLTTAWRWSPPGTLGLQPHTLESPRPCLVGLRRYRSPCLCHAPASFASLSPLALCLCPSLSFSPLRVVNHQHSLSC